MRWVVLVFVAGCMASAGPVVAYRPQSRAFAAGFDASLTGFGAGIHGGNTFSPGRPTASYVALRGVLPLAPHPDLVDGFRDDYQVGLGGSLGWGFFDHHGTTIGAWPQFLAGDFNDCSGAFVYAVQLGVRLIADHAEIFASPQIGRFSAFCFD